MNVGSLERVASAVLGGTLFAFGSRRSGVSRAVFALLGGGLVYRGVGGHCPVYRRLGAGTAGAEPRDGDREPRGSKRDAREVQRSITIGRPAAELYALWQRPETQARIMAHFAQVSAEPSGNLRWRTRALPRALSFETTCIEARDGELLRWQSLAGGDLHAECSALFRPAPRTYGTELTVQVRFDPVGDVSAKISGKILGITQRLPLERALRNFKSLVECGEIPSTFHNPSARRGARSDAQAPHALLATH